MLISIESPHKDCSLGDMVLHDGTWNLDLFRLWVLDTIICKIIGIPPLHPSAGEDMNIWGGMMTSSFSVKSAYRKIQGNSWKQKEEVWKTPWKFHGPQRVRFFIWLVLKHRLLMNVERVQWGINHSSMCGVCRHIIEDLLHTFWDCLPTRDIWNLLIPTDRLVSFFPGNLQEWITSNLQNKYDLGLGEVELQCFFGILIWHI